LILTPFLLLSRLFLEPIFRLVNLRQRRMQIVVLRNIPIKDPAVVPRHIQCTVPHELLEGKRIAATIHQILAGEGVPELMD